MQTIQYKKSRICEMKEDEYTISLAKNQVCAIFQMRDIQTNVIPGRYTQIYEALYGNAMVVSFSGTPRWRPETNRNICFLLMREFFA